MAKYKYWVPAVVWMGAIFYLSGRTGSEIGNMFPFMPNLDLGHLGEYFMLGLLVYYGLVKANGRHRPFGLTILICTVFGATDEFHQYFVPGRSADIFDLINDAIGSALAMTVINCQTKQRFALLIAAAMVVVMVLFNIWKPVG